MKKILLSLLVFCCFSCFVFSKGKSDKGLKSEQIEDVPTEGAEYALSGEEIEEPKVKTPKYKLREVTGNKVTLSESWGYVMQNREDEYDKSMPITDVCYFSGEVNCYGELVGVPKRSKLDVGKARCHLVITCDSKSLTHFILDGEYGVRKNLIKEIVKAAAPYDGVQIDFELIPARDRKHFITFLGDLRYSLKGKYFSVCVPARFKLLSEDIYPYAEIAKYSDRVFVMAYDEHWSTSKPGPVASVDWCEKIFKYAKEAIPERKLIMGIPFYGRTWASETTASAWYFSGSNRIMTEHDVETVEYENDIPKFTYNANVQVTGYFNDASSVLAFCRMYQEKGLKKMGFWRIGQEDPEVWNWIEIK